jgi:hypothetical protein
VTMDERHGGGTRIRDDVSDFEIRRADKIVCGSRVSHVNVFFFFFHAKSEIQQYLPTRVWWGLSKHRHFSESIV